MHAKSDRAIALQKRQRRAISEVALTDPQCVTRHDKQVRAQFELLFFAGARALHENIFLARPVAETLCRRDGLCNRQTLAIGIFARLVDFAQNVEGPESQYGNRDARVAEIPGSKPVPDLGAHRIDCAALGPDLADQRNGNGAVRPNLLFAGQAIFARDRERQLVVDPERVVLLDRISGRTDSIRNVGRQGGRPGQDHESGGDRMCKARHRQSPNDSRGHRPSAKYGDAALRCKPCHKVNAPRKRAEIRAE